MKRCTIHINDEINCRIDGLHPEDNNVLWEKFGFFVDGYFHMPAYQLRRWDGKIRFFEKNGKTYTKLLEEILPYLCTWKYEINFLDKRLPIPKIDQRVDENIFGKEDFKLRPYQVEVINALLDAGSGLAICATASGKTSMCAALALVLYLHKLQTIVIVPSSDLVTQTANEFKDKLRLYEEHITIGEYSGSGKDIDHPIVIATWQSLQNAPHYMKDFQAIIVDEAHGAKAMVIKDLVANHGRHISHRYGVTGTMPKPVVDQYSLKTSIGAIVREVPAKWLIDNGYLAEIEIEPVETVDDDPDLPDYAAEKEYISKLDNRNEAIAQDIMRKRDEHGNTLVLVYSIPQGQHLQTLIPGSVFLFGESAKQDRKDKYDEYDREDNLIVIATVGIASLGIDIDRIFCMYLIDIGKSFIRSIQSVGRGLRKKGDKFKIHVVDLYSRLKHSKKHSKIRKRYFEEADYPMTLVRKLRYESES